MRNSVPRSPENSDVVLGEDEEQRTGEKGLTRPGWLQEAEVGPRRNQAMLPVMPKGLSQALLCRCLFTMEINKTDK